MIITPVAEWVMRLSDSVLMWRLKNSSYALLVCIFNIPEKTRAASVFQKPSEGKTKQNCVVSGSCTSHYDVQSVGCVTLCSTLCGYAVDLLSLTSRRKHGQRPCFRSLPKGMETCYAGEISMYTERENRIQVATLEKTQLIAKDFSELRIHFWPDVWPFMVGL
ncbi:predicted protein [Histoplasma mississippiense (nom. inval.)]|uniref:predicted protein n=1 Tax=Ajellomyces capsulatus (strain NAm1 / WU24) TaxID=2059318 RepID=UPI000157D5C3|nr:predicted protein [Histoplasma mississippiense (nom. inval.)]EDN05452.1 predicted protein [Histoplasma mississippiense (nom. inval.)]